MRGARCQLAVCRHVQPPARSGRMRQRDHSRPAKLVATADARREAAEAEQPLDREAAHRNDQLGLQELELPSAPESAELLLARRRRPVAAAGDGAPRIAARHRRAVEGGVEVLLVEVEPAPQRLAGAPAPRTALLALDDAGSLPVHVRTLARVHVANRQRLERIAGLAARTADREVTLQRRERAIRAAPARHARTMTNQRPSCSTPPPPSSAASWSPVKTRLKTVQREPSLRTRSS